MKLRHIVTMLLCLLLTAAMGIPALADAIFEPRDSFYANNTKDCVYVSRSYTANGKSGAVDIVKEPGSAGKVATIKNGNQFYVSFTYKDKAGADWGVVMFNPDGKGNLGKTDNSTAKSGWVKMSDMKIVYDSISFEEDHKSEFKPYTGSYDALRSAAKIVFWTYPGSGVIARTVESKDLDKNFAINNAYTDKDGRVWGGISYYRGIRNAWICMSDPSGTNIAVSPSPGSAAPSASSNSSPATPSGGTLNIPKDQTPTLILIAVIVGAVVVVTAVLIAVFWRKKKTTGVPR